MMNESDLGADEAAAKSLAADWVLAGLAAKPCAGTVQAAVAAARARGDERLAWLSQGFEALHLMLAPRADAAQLPLIEARLDQLRNTGWTRAIRLAEAAWAYCAGAAPEHLAQAIELLRSHGDVAHDPRPPAERLWTDALLCMRAAEAGHLDEAMHAGVVAERLAAESGIELLTAVAAHSLASAFLAAGDFNGVLELQPRAIAALRGSGITKVTTYFTWMVALLQSGRPADVLKVLDDNPWMAGRQVLENCPHLGSLLACALAESGRRIEAQMLLRALRPVRADDAMQLLDARTWLSARMLLATDKPADARRLLQAHLDVMAQRQHEPTTTDGIQLHLAFSNACEALDDWPAAMQALRRSQAYEARWKGRNMHSRLRLMRQQVSSSLDAKPAMEAPHDAGTGTTTVTDMPPAAHSATAAAVPDAKQQTRYVAHVAHEMRNPVGGMIGLTTMLKMSRLDERQRVWVDQMQSSGQVLLELCNNLLDMAKIESGKFDLEPDPIDVGPLVTQVMAAHGAAADAKQLQLRSEIDAGVPTLMLDRKRVTQIVNLLLDNAIKFTAAGHVRLQVGWRSLAGGHGELRVAVHDTGPGLDAGQQATLFKDLAQLGGINGSNAAGSGLSLGLCRALVRRMGGQMGVDSAPGRGSCFWFTLQPELASAPLPAAASGAAPVANAQGR